MGRQRAHIGNYSRWRAGRGAVMANAQFAEIGPAFAQHYYTTFDTARVNLQTLYKDQSMLSFENEQFMGMQAIMTKLTTLQFQTVQHKITTCDAQPVTEGNAILVMVTGDLAVDGNVTTPLKFAQTFHLHPDGASWYIKHDMFRLNYG